MISLKQVAQNILSKADVKINGSRSWDIKVNNPNLYKRILKGGSLAIGEAYMDGWWDSKAIDQLVYKLITGGLYSKKYSNYNKILSNAFRALVINFQRKSRAFDIGKKHYDIDNELYKNMLDKRLNYSCGYWKNAKSLDEAQVNKLDLICKKVGLKKGDRILDIGCGWGGFAKYATKKYKVEVVGITVSKEQVKLARELTKGLPIEIRLQDYRDLNEKFDHIISIGMIEHVGYKNYRTYMEIVNKNLKDGGLFLLHTIGNNNSRYINEPWINKYIFPGSVIPSAKQLTTATEKLFVLEDWHNFGTDYDKTLMAWYKNFNKNWPKYKSKYGERFYRMWKYYLLYLAGGFRARHLQLWQIVLSKDGIPGGYESVR